MTREEFLKQQFMTLREEIRGGKMRAFWVVVLGTVLVPGIALVADHFGSVFGGASIPFVVLVLMTVFVVEQSDIVRAGRFIRERIEPQIAADVGWEAWLESNPRLREMDRIFFGSFLIILLANYAIATRVALESLAQRWPEQYWYATYGYAVGALWFLFVVVRHWRACTTTTS